MFCLVASVPAVHAELLAIEKISGVDNADNFIRENDILTIEALVNIPGDPIIERDQLRIYFDTSTGYLNFDSCEKKASGSVCTFKKNLYAQSKTHDYTIKLYSDQTKGFPDSAPEAQSRQPVTVDSAPPAIKAFDFEPKITSSGDIVLSYSAEDYSEESDKTICSGIKEIRIAKEDFSGEQIAVIEGKQCAVSGSYSAAVQSAGRFDICAFAVDNMGKVSNGLCREIIVDKNPPAVEEVNFYIDGERITHIGRQASTTVDVEVVFNELSLKRAEADFAGIARGSFRDATSAIEDNRAFFSSVSIGGFSDCKFRINAEDKVGNIFNEEVGCSIGMDAISPDILGLESSKKDAGNNNLVGGDAEFRVRLKEDHSGLYKKQIYIDLSRIGMGSRVQADRCERIGTEWECQWKVGANRGFGKQQIFVSGSDDLWNPVAGKKDFEVIVDLVKPVIRFVGVKAINDPAKLVFIAGDVLEFEFDIEDFGSAYADLSAIGYDEDVLPDYCIDTEVDGKNVTKCFWRPIDIFISETGKAQLHFYFFDAAGNKATKTISIELLEKFEVGTPNYWKVSKVECSPNPIDRSVTPYIPQGYKVVCRVGLSSGNSNARVTHISFNPADCEGDFAGKILAITPSNTGPSKRTGQKEFYLSIVLDKSDFLIPDFSFECPVKLSTRLGKRYVANPEEETIPITLSFFDNPLGTSFESYDKKIREARNRAKSIHDVTKYFEDFFDNARKVCEIKGIFTSLLGALDNVILVLGLAGETAEKTPTPVTAAAGSSLKASSSALCYGPKSILEDSYIGPAEKALGELKISGETTGSDVFGFVEDFCRYINCNLEGEKAPVGSYFKHYGSRVFSLNTLAGGGAPWCTDTIDWLNNEVLGSIKLEGLAKIDIKESLVLSIGCWCLPGIIRNMNKIAEVNCKYALCMKEKVKELGFPESVCEKELAYDECMFVYGEIFNAIPITQALSKMFTKFEEMLSNWPGLVFSLVGGAVCTKTLCQYWWAYYGCIATKTLNKILDAVTSIQTIATKDYWQSQTSYCKELFEKD